MKAQSGNYGKGGRKPGQPKLVSVREKPYSPSKVAKTVSAKNRQKAQARRDVARRKAK